VQAFDERLPDVWMSCEALGWGAGGSGRVWLVQNDRRLGRLVAVSPCSVIFAAGNYPCGLSREAGSPQAAQHHGITVVPTMSGTGHDGQTVHRHGAACPAATWPPC